MTTSEREAALRMRADFLHRVRLHHLLNACSMVHYGLDGSRWVGDDTRGMFVAVNNADHQMIAWNAEGFVAVVWDDDEPPLVDGPGGRHVWTALLEQLPPSLKPLLNELTKGKNLQPPTSTRWLEVTDEGHKVGGDGLGSDQLNAYDQPLETLLAGWRKLYSLSEAQAGLALELAASRSGARHTLSAAEEDTLLASPEPLRQKPLVPAQVGRAAAMLKHVGIDWPAAEEHAAARARDDSDHGLALLAAVEAGNHAEVKALLAKGANWRKQPEGHASLPRHALNAAAGSGDKAMLELILNHAGEAVTKHELSVALMAAVNSGSRALADVLLARGAEKKEALVSQAISSGRPEAIAIAIDLGVTPRMPPFWFEKLRKVCLDGNRRTFLLATQARPRWRRMSSSSTTHRSLRDARSTATSSSTCACATSPTPCAT